MFGSKNDFVRADGAFPGSYGPFKKLFTRRKAAFSEKAS
jgi:hypothetical protein